MRHQPRVQRVAHHGRKGADIAIIAMCGMLNHGSAPTRLASWTITSTGTPRHAQLKSAGVGRPSQVDCTDPFVRIQSMNRSRRNPSTSRRKVRGKDLARLGQRQQILAHHPDVPDRVPGVDAAQRQNDHPRPRPKVEGNPCRPVVHTLGQTPDLDVAPPCPCHDIPPGQPARVRRLFRQDEGLGPVRAGGRAVSQPFSSRNPPSASSSNVQAPHSSGEWPPRGARTSSDR